jgi:hypothetical protein
MLGQIILKHPQPIPDLFCKAVPKHLAGLPDLTVEAKRDQQNLNTMLQAGRCAGSGAPACNLTEHVLPAKQALQDEFKRAYVGGSAGDDVPVPGDILEGLRDDLVRQLSESKNSKGALEISMVGAGQRDTPLPYLRPRRPITTPIPLAPVLAHGAHSLAGAKNDLRIQVLMAHFHAFAVQIMSGEHMDITAESLKLCFGSFIFFDTEREVLLLCFGTEGARYTYDTQNSMEAFVDMLVVPEGENRTRYLAVVAKDNDNAGYLNESQIPWKDRGSVRKKMVNITAEDIAQYETSYPAGTGKEKAPYSQAFHNDTSNGADTAPNRAMLFIINIGKTAIPCTDVALCEFRDKYGKLSYKPWLVYARGPVPRRPPLASAKPLPLPQIQPGGFAAMCPAVVHRASASTKTL